MIDRLPAPALAAALLAVSACSSGGSPAAQEQDARAGNSAKTIVATGAAPAEPTPAASPRPTVVAAAKGEWRCGWLANPTPGNWWLDDAQGQWVLATQGSEPAPGMEDMPDMSTAGWVETNGHYGYGCACMTIAYDPATERVTRVADAKPRPLKQCRADKNLRRPE